MAVLSKECRVSDQSSILQPALFVSLLDFLLWFGVDLYAFSEEHGVHASLGVCSRGVQQQVGQLCGGNAGVTISQNIHRQLKQPANMCMQGIPVKKEMPVCLGGAFSCSDTN